MQGFGRGAIVSGPRPNSTAIFVAESCSDFVNDRSAKLLKFGTFCCCFPQVVGIRCSSSRVLDQVREGEKVSNSLFAMGRKCFEVFHLFWFYDVGFPM
jgi:hypothetical protein